MQWDADIASVEGGEIRVKLKENFSVTTSISHNFVSFPQTKRNLLHRFPNNKTIVSVLSRSEKHSSLWLTVNPADACFFKASTAGRAGIAFISAVLLPSHPCAIRLTWPKTHSSRCKFLDYYDDRFRHCIYRNMNNNKWIPYRLISCPEGPEIYSAGLSYPASFQPIQIPRRHPPPLAQRERSTSAPNVCYNMVGTQSGMDAALEDWSYRIKVQNLAATGMSGNCLFAWLLFYCIHIGFLDIGYWFVPNFHYVAYKIIIFYYLINQN